MEINFVDSVAIADGSRRVKDSNGYLTIYDNPLATAGVFPYRAKELGLPGEDRIVSVFRSPDDLMESKSLFARKPILHQHKWVGRKGEVKKPDGAVGDNISFADDTVRGNITIFNDELIDLIETGQCKQLSPGYNATIVNETGEFNNQNYDMIMKITSVNHIAVVPTGRAGKMLEILDEEARVDVTTQQRDMETVESTAEVDNAMQSSINDTGGDYGDFKKELPETPEPKAADGGRETELYRALEKRFTDEIRQLREELHGAEARYFANLNEVNAAVQDVQSTIGIFQSQGFKDTNEVYKYGYEMMTGRKLMDTMDAKTAFTVAKGMKSVNSTSVISTANNKWTSFVDNIVGVGK